MKILLLAATLAAAACTTTKEDHAMTSLSGKRIRWSFTDGPMAGTTFEHVFDADRSVTWSVVDGPNKGATQREKLYAAEQIDDQTWAVSYLAASGYTLTVVLNFANHRAIGFASNDKIWVPQHGTFEVVH